MTRTSTRFSVASALTWTFGLALLATSGHGEPTIKPLAPKTRAKLKLAFVTNNASDYWTVARTGVEQAARELGIAVDFKLPGQGTAAEQAQIVQDLLAHGVNGIAISPVDPANQTDILNKAAQQALVFTQDTDAPQSKRACYIGTDNQAAGRQAGEQLRRVLPRGGKVMAFAGVADSRNVIERVQGLRDALRGTRIQLLGVRIDDTDRAKAKSNVEDALAKHPDLAACVGIWSYNGPTILSALQEVGKVGKVKIVCFDEEDDTLQGVKGGQIAATIVQQPFEFGYLSVITLAKVLNGDKSAIPANHRLFVPTLVVNQSNVDAFKKNLDQMRRRYSGSD